MSAALRIEMGMVLLCFGIGLGGCESGMEPTPPDPREPGIFGVWLHETGPFISGLDSVEARALILSPDGAGRVIFQDADTGALDSVRVFNVFDGKSLFLDFNADAVKQALAYPTVVVDENLLQIVDAQNVITSFTRVDTLPADLTLGASVIAARIDGLPQPTDHTGLVIRGGDLNYSSVLGSVERIIAATGVVGAPVGGALQRHVQAAQQVGFWSHCACDGSQEAKLQNPSGGMTFDTVHTGTDLDAPLMIRGLAYIAEAGDLWLHGESADHGQMFAIVAADREPDVLIKTIPFDTQLQGLTYHNGELWAIASLLTRSIVCINPANGKLTATYEVPDENVRWIGLSFDDEGKLFMLGTTPAAEGVIAEVTLE